MPFSGGSGHNGFSVGFTKDPRLLFGVFTRGYRFAANSLANCLLAKAGFRSYEAYPVVFLYRHALELALKNVIYKGARLASFQRLEVIDKRLYITHSLTRLAEQSRQVLLTRFPQDSALKGIADDIVLVAKDFDLIDPDSCAYRYPIDRTGQPAVRETQWVDLEVLSERMEETLEHLDTIDLEMGIETDKAQELFEIYEDLTWEA
ncbi:MAG: hypothetical protein ACOYXY_05970 [Thermodesulfobacteriota bacterium]